MNPVITNLDSGSVSLANGKFRDELLTFAGAGTVFEGTILARNTGSGKLVPWESAGAGGNEIIKAVITHDVVADGAGDVPIRPLIAGEVRAERLIEHGKEPGVDITSIVLDELKGTGIVGTSVTELGNLDNQP